MSTLAAARADNFYYPPTFDPKKGGLNKQQGQHPLRERAKKLDEGILVIRFEMPFNVWCQGCQHLIGKGVRFNAEKKQIGNYHSTKIWSFSMRSPCCQTRIEVHTDPKNCEYQIVAGARRKAEAYTAEDAGVMELDDPAEAAAAARDPFTKLERGDADKRKAAEAARELSMLVADSRVKHRDDYAINKELRRRNRGLRKEEAGRDEQRRRLNLPDSIQLAPHSEQDRQAAALVVFGDPARFDERGPNGRLGLQSAGVAKRKSSSLGLDSKSGSRHAISQAGKLSRIRLGAKLVLGDVPV
ncbi:hypothetical protein WJX84_011653 [Apatococcus fuscideae]|uniref:Coiled-coil domain-containing protein 130 n=1 Tax=Apatococcus fuscideae TaxID=2026836 RepID=A0AAW1SV94_9CHLO